MGHENVQLMQGSLEDWVAAGGPVDEEPTTVILAKDLLKDDDASSPVSPSQPSKYIARDPIDVVDMKTMVDYIEQRDNMECTIVDPRGPKSFNENGHMPGAKNLPYRSLVQAENPLKLKGTDELKVLFHQAGIDIQSEKPIVCSCGSGVSVCHVYLALEECGRKGKTVMYDGSWNEWSQDPHVPKVITEN